MRYITTALIILALLALSVSAGALSIPFHFGSLTSFPTSTTAMEPLNLFSSGNGLGSSFAHYNALPTADNGVLFDTIVSPVVGSNWNWPQLGNGDLFGNSLTIPSNDNSGVSGSTGTGSVPDSVVNAIVNCSNVEPEPLHNTPIDKSSVKLINSKPVSFFASGIEKGAVINEYQFNTVDGKTHTCHVEIYRDPRDWPQVQDIDGTSYEL